MNLGNEASAAPEPAADTLRRELAGEGDGIFWIPVKGAFPDEDLLLLPDGSYITHLHDRPSSAGMWRLEEKRLILEGFMGSGTWIVESVRLKSSGQGKVVNGSKGGSQVELHGHAEGEALVMRQLDPTRPAGKTPPPR